MENDIDIYLGKRDTFYCVLIEDKSVTRDNKLSELFGDPVSLVYHNPSRSTEYIYCAKFWKDKGAALQHIKTRPNRRILELTREEFINSIPDKEFAVMATDITYLKNLERKIEEVEYNKIWIEYRKKYRCTNAYKKVKDPQWWLPCKFCGLIPLVWEFDNGRSTACGCGESEYVHHSIGAESVMSYVTRNNGSALGYNSAELRMNWNQWVKTGQDIFKEMRLKNGKIW